MDLASLMLVGTDRVKEEQKQGQGEKITLIHSRLKCQQVS